MKYAVASVVSIVSAAALLAACTDAAVSKAVGAGGTAGAEIAIQTSASTLTVENRAGRPLLDVRITIDASGPDASFVRVVPTVDTGAKSEAPLADFRTDDGALLDTAFFHPTRVTVTARDTLAKTYTVTAPWTP